MLLYIYSQVERGKRGVCFGLVPLWLDIETNKSCECVCVCVCMFVHICMHAHVCVRLRVHLHMHTCKPF